MADMDGDELKRWRDALGMTQKQIAALLGVDALMVSKWERGERSIPPQLSFDLETFKRQMQHPGRKKGEKN